MRCPLKTVEIEKSPEANLAKLFFFVTDAAVK
jgi:hypothetical protein